jgi:hypothetical protein
VSTQVLPKCQLSPSLNIFTSKAPTTQSVCATPIELLHDRDEWIDAVLNAEHTIRPDDRLERFLNEETFEAIELILKRAKENIKKMVKEDEDFARC